MTFPNGNFTTGQALMIAAISAAMYGVFLLIQTKPTRACLSMNMKTMVMTLPIPIMASHQRTAAHGTRDG